VNERGQLPVESLAKPSHKRHACPEVLPDLIGRLRLLSVETVEIKHGERRCRNGSARA
jgi:hypothetical protein